MNYNKAKEILSDLDNSLFGINQLYYRIDELKNMIYNYDKDNKGLGMPYTWFKSKAQYEHELEIKQKTLIRYKHLISKKIKMFLDNI